jgi:hypothetical protein
MLLRLFLASDGADNITKAKATEDLLETKTSE